MRCSARRRQLHGATYVVEATFRGPELDADQILIDIGLAGRRLHELVGGLTNSNLDDNPAFRGVNSTTEVLARYLADQLADALKAGELGPSGATVSSIAVLLQESPVAAAGFERAP